MNHTHEVRAQFGKIPDEKRGTMIVRTIWGVGIVAFGIVMKMKLWPNLPDLVAFGTVVFGAVMLSGQLFLHPWKLFVAGVRDLFNAIQGKNGNGGTH